MRSSLPFVLVSAAVVYLATLFVAVPGASADDALHLEPDVEEVWEVALRSCALTELDVDRWLQRARRSRRRPTQLRFEARSRADVTGEERLTEDQDFDGRLVPGDAASEFRELDDRSWTVEGRVVVEWDLSQPRAADAELDILRQSERLDDARRRIANEAVDLYFERRELQLQWLAAEGNSSDRAQYAIDIDELSARLSVLTNGWFAEELVRRGIPGGAHLGARADTH